MQYVKKGSPQKRARAHHDTPHPNTQNLIFCRRGSGGDNSYATGMGLLADYVGSTPMYHAGSKDDSRTFQCLFWVARFGADTSKMELDQAAYFECAQSLASARARVCFQGAHFHTARPSLRSLL